MSRKSLAVVRDIHLNLWDIGNYYGVTNYADLYVCGRGDIDWVEIMKLYPKARPVVYNRPHEVMNYDFDVLDLPDAHYGFTQYFVDRHPKTVIVGWDNLPGKNMTPEAIHVLKTCWKVTARSLLAHETLTKFDGVSPAKTRVIYGAVDTEFFHPPSSNENRENAVLYVGRLTQEKGLLPLIWAMKYHPDMELWVVGEGGDREFFESWATRLEVKTKWFGFVDRYRLAALYRKAKIFCLPSMPKITKDPFDSWMEQFGQVLIEAAASGLPASISRSGAIAEVIRGSIAHHPGDFAELAAGIQIYKDADEDSYDFYSKSIRDYVAENYSYDVIGKQIKDWYEL